MNKQKYLSSAFLLILSSVLVKAISAVYKIPLTSYIGTVGRGYFASAYNLYMPVHAIVMGSLPVALSKLIGKYNASNNMFMLSSLKKSSLRLFTAVGVAGSAIIILLSVPYCKSVASTNAIYTVLALAPCVLFSSVAASYRSYFEGFVNMLPTALSQFIEALFKLVFGLLFAKLTMAYLYNKYLLTGYVFNTAISSNSSAVSAIYPFASAGAMLGVTFGSFASMVFCMVYYGFNKLPNTKYKKLSYKSATNELVSFALPIMVTCSVQGAFQLLDSVSVQYALGTINAKTLSAFYSNALSHTAISNNDLVAYVYGLLSAALDFKNIVPGITMALGVCAVPVISAASELGDSCHLANLINTILKYSVLLSCLGSVAMLLCSKDMLYVFYSKNSYDIVIGCNDLVRAFSLALPLYSISGTSVYIIQALGKPNKTILPFVVSGVIRLFLNLLLVGNSKLILFGDVISDFVGYFVMAFWCLVIIKNTCKCKINLKNIAIKPVLVSVITYFICDYLFKCANLGSNNAVYLLIKCAILFLIFCILCFSLKLLKFSDIFLTIKHKKMA